MLPVSDLVAVAREEMTGAKMSADAPHRFDAAVGWDSPVIVWNVCRHCNMTCPHCYAVAASDPSPDDLCTAEARTLIDDLADCGVRLLIFSGGEPMLRRDLIDLIAHAKRRGIAPQLSTNGVLIEEAAAARLAQAGVGYVGISIDGLPAFNDAYRGMESAFDAALRGAKCAKAAGMKTGLRMTLTNQNAKDLPALLDTARAVQADRFYVSHLLYSGRGYKMAARDLARAEARALLESLFRSAEAMLSAGERTKIVTGSNDSDGPFLLRWIVAHYGEEAGARVRKLLARRGGNSAGEKVLNIDHKGRVHPDQFWREETLGDVRKQRFAEILKHPMREQLRRRTAYLEGRCATCRHTDLCRGSHRERALAHSGNLWAPDPACVMEDAEIF